MSDKTSDETLEDWFAHPGYQIFKEEVEAEVYNTQASILEDSKSWDEVMFARGWCKALTYVATMREVREQVLAMAEEQARDLTAHL